MKRPKRLYAYALLAVGLAASAYVSGIILSRSENSLPFVACWVLLMGGAPAIAYLDWHSGPKRYWIIGVALYVVDWTVLCGIAQAAQYMKIIPNPFEPSELSFVDSIQILVFAIGTVAVVLIAGGCNRCCDC